MFQAREVHSASPVLSSLQLPTLVLHRIDDRHRSAAESRAMAAQIPQAQLVLLPGADHVPWVGDREAVVSALHTFLAELPTPRLSG
jgi:pimeloyl-ACP methyl ester carboxylesterase